MASTSSRAQWHDRSWVRADMAAWDERWAGLSPLARRAFLDVRAAARPESAPPKTPAARFPAAAVEELARAGLVEVIAGPRGASQLIVPQVAFSFAARLRSLVRYRLLRDSHPTALRNYVGHAYDAYHLRQYLTDIVEKATGQRTMYQAGDPLDAFVPLAAWPEWVADWLEAPLARPILEAIGQAGGRLPITEVAGRISGASAAEVRSTIDRLVIYLALVEDLNESTFQVEVGLLPDVHEAQLCRAAAPRSLPEAEAPREVLSASGIEVPDLRALLLEIASDPPRVRQDHGLFVKELPRFAAAMPPLPEGLFESPQAPEDRVDLVVERAYRMKFAREQRQGSEKRLVLTDRGRQWLASPTEEQYAAIYTFLRSPPQDFYGGEGDRLFLGSGVFATPAPKRGTRDEFFFFPISRDLQPLREAVYRAWSLVPVGKYFPSGTLIAYLAQSPHNPLLLGTTPDKVRFWVGGRPLPALPELIEKAGEKLLGEMLTARLIPLGAVQLGWNAQGEPLIARLPRLDVYFGKAPPAAPAGEDHPTRVIVQPDFSIMVIGPSPEPAAALAPFCERVQGHSGAAITYKVTRESVVRGLALGMKLDEVLARLEKHASTGVPANVRKQIESWASRVRTVTVGTVDLVRCPDAETAQRLVAALGKGAERLADTLVALPPGSLKGAVRQKLRLEGLLVEKIKE